MVQVGFAARWRTRDRDAGPVGNLKKIYAFRRRLPTQLDAIWYCFFLAYWQIDRWAQRCGKARIQQ
jgi:hypothetical protein